MVKVSKIKVLVKWGVVFYDWMGSVVVMLIK